MTTLTFRNTALETVCHNDQIWFTSSELAKALEYSNTKSIANLYNQNLDEFTCGMSEVIDSVTSTKSKGYVNLLVKTRIFSLRGAHLIAMFARTPVAKEFRNWVLDILEREAGNPVHQHPQHKPEAPELLSSDDVNHLSRLIWCMSSNFQFNRSWSHGIWYALRQATGIPSPQRFEVRQIPLIAQECRRIYQVTSRLQTLIAEAEKQTVRRILRKREDADRVLTEMAALLRQAETESYTALAATLDKWQENKLNQFLQRH